jgi:hypothetical protein
MEDIKTGKERDKKGKKLSNDNVKISKIVKCKDGKG